MYGIRGEADHANCPRSHSGKRAAASAHSAYKQKHDSGSSVANELVYPPCQHMPTDGVIHSPRALDSRKRVGPNGIQARTESNVTMRARQWHPHRVPGIPERCPSWLIAFRACRHVNQHKNLVLCGALRAVPPRKSQLTKTTKLLPV